MEGGHSQKANVAVVAVVAAIKEVGLKMAPQKTQAVFFYEKSMGRPPKAHIMVEGTRVSVGASMKLLGLWLDGSWSFGEHFARLLPRAKGVANSLARLMPNLGGASGRARRLYAATVHAVTLYGAPVWAPVVEGLRCIKAKLRQVQRSIALRMFAYCTVSHAAATALTGLPPLELAAHQYAEIHRRIKELQDQSCPGHVERSGSRKGRS
ncbi:uncharacterized protein LOC112466347 [Temnothorax curvispinosus]|uniref:Uncharacterized protein LOC112466347 n=1 Tax=Temnothorax curvispinosus TaxID=300111 RepID=A0A6J1RBN3_9HYME|nr:uncharacterized protein LOC112466347 [Temnothorax curvispinosus]